MTTEELIVYEPTVPTLFGTDDPEYIANRTAAIGDVLGKTIRERGWSMKIGAGEHVRVEGWTFLGSLLGLSARTEWSRPLTDVGGWEARVQLVTLDGRVLAAAEASCSREEKNWRNSDDFAVRSMAQTRAMGKAFRMQLGFIAGSAGFETTPAEEMPSEPAAVASEGPVVLPGQYEIRFGKYQGQTIGEIASHDKGYVKWLGEKAANAEVKAAAVAYLNDEDIPF